MDDYHNPQFGAKRELLQRIIRHFPKCATAILFFALPLAGVWIGHISSGYGATNATDTARPNQPDTNTLPEERPPSTNKQTPNTGQNILVCVPTGSHCVDYNEPVAIVGSYPDSLEKINEVYYKDEKKVFALWYTSSDSADAPAAFVVEGADPTTFKPIYSEAFRGGVRLAKDSHYVYLDNKSLQNVDPNTLQLYDFSKRLIADRSGVYLNGRTVNYLDSSTFSIESRTELGDDLVVFASDKNGKYKMVVSGADDHWLTIERL